MRSNDECSITTVDDCSVDDFFVSKELYQKVERENKWLKSQLIAVKNKCTRDHKKDYTIAIGQHQDQVEIKENFDYQNLIEKVKEGDEHRRQLQEYIIELKCELADLRGKEDWYKLETKKIILERDINFQQGSQQFRIPKDKRTISKENKNRKCFSFMHRLH